MSAKDVTFKLGIDWLLSKTQLERTERLGASLKNT